MIKTLTLKNFQSHKDTTLNFHPGVNVIVGSTDSGKSAIIRALRWICFNKPSGDSFCSNWGGGTVVNLFTDKGIVTRRKGDYENNYQLHLYENKIGESIFTSFGQDIPAPIADFINVDDINFQAQHDPHFLLSETSGQVAAFFNKIAGIDVIDMSIKEAKKEISKTKTEIDYTSKIVQSKKEELQKYDNLDVIEVKVEELEQKEMQIKTIKNQQKNITMLLSSISATNEKLEEYKNILKIEKKLNTVLELTKKKRTEKSKYDALLRLLTQIKTVSAKIKDATGLLQHEKKTALLLQKIQTRKQKTTVLNNLKTLISNFSRVNSNIAKLGQEITKKQGIFTEHLTVCPLCNTKLKNV